MDLEFHASAMAREPSKCVHVGTHLPVDHLYVVPNHIIKGFAHGISWAERIALKLRRAEEEGVIQYPTRAASFKRLLGTGRTVDRL